MPHTLASIAQRIGGQLDGPAELEIHGVCALADAVEGQLSFLAKPRYRKLLETTQAAAVLVQPDEPCHLPCIRIENPYLAFVSLLHEFGPRLENLFEPGVHATAVVHPTAQLGSDIRLGPHAVVGANCVIGDRTILGASTVLMPDCRVGSDCVLYPNVTLREGSELGDRVILHAGVVIGADGFGFLPGEDGYHKVPQIGIVCIEDDVEVGANSCIDRATTGRTIIGRGTKLDNLVQIAHNVRVGQNTAISSQTGISGSAQIGDGVVLAGQVGIGDNVKVGDGTMSGGQAGITNDVPAKSRLWGTPAREIGEVRRQVAHVRRLSGYVEEIRDLQRRIQALENANGAETAENS